MRATCGSKYYFAPEVVKKKAYDKMVDWWAVGIIAYEMIAGKHPFQSKNKDEVLTNIAEAPLVFPDQKKQEYKMSAELEDFIRKLLDKDQNTRLG